MKRIFTKLKIRAHQIYLWVVAVAFSLLPDASVSQQISIEGAISSPSPYCAHNNCTPSGTPVCQQLNANYKINIRRVEVGNYFHDNGDDCDVTNMQPYRYFNRTSIKLKPNDDIAHVVKVTIPQGTVGRSIGVWVDFNRNNAFDDNEYLDKGSNFGSFTANTVCTRELKIPCNTPPGIYRMRVRLQYSTVMNSSMACSGGNCYSDAWDFNIEVLPNEPILAAPEFLVPDNIYVNSPAKIKNTTYSLNWDFRWDLDLNGEDANTVDFNVISSTPGSHYLKLKMIGCGISDSTTKVINVLNPSSVPGTDFYANKTQIEEFDEVIMSDISTQGPTSWDWELNHPDNFFSQTSADATPIGPGGRLNRALFLLEDMGSFQVCLTASNSRGNFKRCKENYLEVLPYSVFRLGAGLTATELGSGTIYDRGGLEDNYGTGNNGMPGTNKLRIQPCGAKTITIDFVQFKLGSLSHNLKIWDGPNAVFGIPLHPPGGFNGANTANTFEVVAKSGAVYMEFDASSGGSSDSGFIAYYSTDYGVFGDPSPGIMIGDNQPVAYTGAETRILSSSENILGVPEYYWEVDGIEVDPSDWIGDGEGFNYIFPMAGTYRVSMWIKSCKGTIGGFDEYGEPTGSGYTVNVRVVDPTDPTQVDFVADNTRPAAYQMFTFTSITDKADEYLWEFDPPGKFVFQAPSNKNSKNPSGYFTEDGTYSVKLTAWNSIDENSTKDSLTKEAYIVIANYCLPSVQMISGDIAVRNIKIFNEDDAVVFDQTTSTAELGYESFVSENSYRIPLYLGGAYYLRLTRPSNSDEVSHAVYIDFNGDGEFEASERLLYVKGTKEIATTSDMFRVPRIESVYTGYPVRMRVITAIQNEEPTVCGPLSVGEFEDYYVTFVKTNSVPSITLNGDDVVSTEIGLPYFDLGATALDDFEGDISDAITFDTDLDINTLGSYTYTYFVKNASGNSATPVTRVINVTEDNTPPNLILLGNNPDTIEVFGNYNEAGFSAIDIVDGDVSSDVDVQSNLDLSNIGTYQITYTITDAAGNTATKTRVIVVEDTEAPVIATIGSNQVELGSFWYDQTSVSDNYWSIKDISFTKEYGLTGPVRWDAKGVYTVKYIAVDGSGNRSELTRVYTVDDFTAPNIVLNTADTVNHDVNTPYKPIQPSFTDNNSNSSNLNIDLKSNVNVNELGVYTETYKATDGNGNSSTKVRWVNVIDRVAPVILAPAICSHVGEEFNSASTITITDNYYSNEELRELVETIYSNVNPYIEGTYNVIYSVTDPSGNKSKPYTQQVMISEDCYLVTGVNQVSSNSFVTAYPNPSLSGLFNVDVSKFNGNIDKIELSNEIGLVVKTIDLSEIIDGNFTIDLSNYSNGVYFLRISGNNNNALIKLISVK